MAPAHVLRVPRTDEEGSFVLVHTTQVRTKALDMKLIGTDGLAPYATTIRHSQAASFMVKNCPITEEEWVNTLSALLRLELVADMEIVATVESESTLVMTFRKRVRGITQRLGAIELKYNPDEEIELYDWCGLSTHAYDQARETLASVTAKTSELEETVAQLRRQLDELVDAKKADEAELLVKFRDLLNEKKAKIREQGSLLSAARREAREPVKFEAVSEDEEPVPAAAPAPKAKSKAKPKAKAKPAPSRKAGTSRAAKRKQPVKDEEETEDDEVEQMDIDPAPVESLVEVSDEDRNTTDAETETASEADDDDVPAAAPAAVKPKPVTRGTRAASKQPDVAPQTAPDSSGTAQEELPPKRELPFGRGRAAVPPPPPAKKAAPPPVDDETESDDEL
ncbi:hypothetical protein F5X68DRAFT_273026 [Plectosphaerella plurivora]|uniref:XRCC4 coiled-coil domain-containing protein n=1 Tax=Plectosphaerella plurivora TaxID=936078 RepID=A0A9P9AHU9_9PEZI|nr:hypothetical protein F5X68DRAFT_273026 [Plectosphaerella plurivora]